MNKFLFCLNFVVCHFCHFVALFFSTLSCYVVVDAWNRATTVFRWTKPKQVREEKRIHLMLKRHNVTFIGWFVVKMMFVRESPTAIIFPSFRPHEQSSIAHIRRTNNFIHAGDSFGLIWRDLNIKCFGFHQDSIKMFYSHGHGTILIAR